MECHHIFLQHQELLQHRHPVRLQLDLRTTADPQHENCIAMLGCTNTQISLSISKIHSIAVFEFCLIVSNSQLTFWLLEPVSISRCFQEIRQQECEARCETWWCNSLVSSKETEATDRLLKRSATFCCCRICTDELTQRSQQMTKRRLTRNFKPPLPI